MNLGNIGKKLSDYGGAIGQFFGGLGQAAGNAVTGIENAVLPHAAPPPLPQAAPRAAPPPSALGLMTPGVSALPPPPAAPPPVAQVRKPTSPWSLAANTVLNTVAPAHDIAGMALQAGGKMIGNAATNAAALANKLDNNASLPVVGNAANFVSSMITNPAATEVRGGQALQGQNPYAGMSTHKAVGTAATDVLNAGAALPFGKAVDVAAPVAERLGGGLLARAAGRFAQGTAETAPITAAYGAANELKAGGTPAQIAQAAAENALAGPALGAVHAVAPVVPAAFKLAAKGNQAVGEAGYIGGAKAAGFNEAKAAGGVSPGVDQQPRFEASDENARFAPQEKGNAFSGKSSFSGTLGQVLAHPTLYEDYPQLKGVKVVATDLGSSKVRGGYDQGSNTIHLNSQTSAPQQFTTLMHETQHVIQTIEGHAAGGSPATIAETVKGARTKVQALDKAIANTTDPIQKVRLEAQRATHMSVVQKYTTGKNTPFEAYRALAGEAEARNAASRRTMTDAEREAQPFNSTYDVKPGDQIIHQGGGPAASQAGDVWGTPPGEEDMPPQTAAERVAGQPLTAAQREAILNSPEQQTTNKITAKGDTPKAVVGNTEGIMEERSKRYNDAINTGSKLSAADKSKLSDAVNGVDVGKVENQKLFDKTVAQLKDAHDYSLAADRAAGSETFRYNKGNFSPLYFQADKEALDRLGVPKEERYDLGNGKQAFSNEDSRDAVGSGFRNIERKYGSYTEAAAKTKGILKPLNANALEDARMYAASGRRSITGRLLYSGLHDLAPDEVSDNLNSKGKDMVHAAKGNLPFNVSKRIDKSLRGYKSAEVDNKAGELALKASTGVSTATRKVAFLGAPLHYLNVAGKYSGLMAAKGRFIKMVGDPVQAVAGAVSSKIYAGQEAAAEAAGTREFNRSIGIVERQAKPDLLRHGTSTAGTVNKMSVFSKTQRAMNRYTNVLSWKLGALAERSGVVAGSKNGAEVAREINQVLDTLNSKMEAINPLGERLATSGSLAPHWIRANINLIRDALTKGGGGGTIARQTVLGQRALEATTAIVTGAIITGQMPSFHKALSEAGLLPSNLNPNVATGKNTKGQPTVTNLTPDAIAIVGSAIHGLLTGNTSFATSRETPILSAFSQFASNKDWTGNQIEDPSKAGWQLRLAEKTGLGAVTPFAVQNARNPALTTSQKVGSALGFRTHRDPNDPAYQQAVQYQQGMAQAKSGASQPDAAAITQYLSRQTDSQGNKISAGTAGGRANAVLLIQNAQQGGQALQRVYQVEHNLKNGDPLWQLPLTAPKGQASVASYLNYQAQYEGPEKTGTRMALEGADAALNQSGWLDQLQQARTAYYNGLPPSTSKPSGEPAYPTFSPDVQSTMKAYNAVPGAQQAAYLQSHPEVTDAFSQIADWTNKIRAIEHAPALPEAQKATPQVQATMDEYNALPKGNGPNGGSPNRAAWIKANPDRYAAMSTFLAQTSMASLLKNSVESVYAGQNTQNELKDIYNVGNYDISKVLMNNGINQFALAGQPGFDATKTASGASYAKSSVKGASAGGKSLAKATARYTRQVIKQAGKAKMPYKPSVKLGKVPYSSPTGAKLGKASFKASTGYGQVAKGGAFGAKVGKPKVSMKTGTA